MNKINQERCLKPSQSVCRTNSNMTMDGNKHTRLDFIHIEITQIFTGGLNNNVRVSSYVQGGGA